MADEQTEDRVQLIDAAVSGDTRMVLGYSRAVAQSGVALIAGFRVNARQVDHDGCVLLGKDNNSEHGPVVSCAELCSSEKPAWISLDASFARRLGHVAWPSAFAALSCVAAS